ncbi:MAG: translation initiation factor IF-2 N-terminal domain-containing protein, partial [Firmicutes bacterium]|nr:translation initiation factor IF-2 N-terminal domain-containing protein [Bacillota bacterium]
MTEVAELAKIRVYELAKSLNIGNKELVSKLQELGINVKNHMSSISEEEAQSVRELFEEPKKNEEKKDAPSHVVEEKKQNGSKKTADNSNRAAKGKVENRKADKEKNNKT